jgi:predicted TIM-barrel fold metal-dependent hydrolase
MFIDIHAHAYRKPVPFVVKFCSAEELIQTYDKLGIEKGVLLPIVSPEIYFPQANEDILDMAERYPDRFIPFCNVDPRALTNSPEAPLDKVLSYYKERGCKGIGEVMPNLPVMHPMVQNLFRHAEKVGLPVIFDGSDQLTRDFGLYDDPGLPQLEHTLQRFPNLILFGHGPLFWSEIGRLETPGERCIIFNLKGHQVGRLPEGPIKEEGVVPKLFRRYPNLYGDLSDYTAYNAIARDPEYGPKFLTEFQDRLFFGTDMCFPDMPVPLIDLLKRWRDEGKIGETVFYKIARGNAEKLLGLI